MDRLCALLDAAAEVGTEFVIENPSDRGDRQSPSLFLFADHAPIWLYPALCLLQRRRRCRTCTFAQCMLGAEVQKYTTFLFTPKTLVVGWCMA